MTRDGRLRPERRPRGLVLSTGEEIPHGESLRARIFIVDVGRGDVDVARLTLCQRDAAEGLYAASMSGYLAWLAPRYAEIRSNLRGERDAQRSQVCVAGGHPRSAGIVADLILGLDRFLEFAQLSGAIRDDERAAVSRRCREALLRAVTAQARHIESAEPTALFFRLLSASVASGRAHLAGPDGLEPSQPTAWGWRQFRSGSGDHERSEWRPQGRRVGWVQTTGARTSAESEAVYLEPDASFAAAQELGREQGEALPVAPRTLRQLLQDKGLLLGTEPARGVLTVRRSLEGRRRDVLHVAPGLLHGRTDEPGPGDGCA
jgi:hypothetical protein